MNLYLEDYTDYLLSLSQPTTFIMVDMKVLRKKYFIDVFAVIYCN